MPFTDVNIGQSTEPVTGSWSSTDAIIYALGIGAGAEDPSKELEYTTENSHGIEQKVYNCYSVVLSTSGSSSPLLLAGPFDPVYLVHGEQSFAVRKPIPTDGKITLTSTLEGIYDKGSGALVVGSTTAIDEVGEVLFETTGGYFVKGEKGFGKQAKPAVEWALPDTEPDFLIEQTTRHDQALHYRLAGDRNPLHSDPAFANRAGFPAPILHGLGTKGFAFRALGEGVGDPARVTAMSVRFARPVFPGATLRTEAWVDGTTIIFRTLDSDGQVVLDRGVATVEA